MCAINLGPAKTVCTILGRLVIVCAQKNTAVSWTYDKPAPEDVGGGEEGGGDKLH